MTTPNTDPSDSKNPTPEMLAGVYLLAEGDEDLTILPCRPPEAPAPGAAEILPIKEELADHYILVDRVEDLTVRACNSTPTQALDEPCAFDWMMEKGFPIERIEAFFKARYEGFFKGRIEGMQRMLLVVGRKLLGPPDEGAVAALHAIEDLHRLDRLTDAVVDVASWQELLATP